MLNNPDARRGLRSIVAAVATVALIYLVYLVLGMLEKQPDQLLRIAEGCLMIIGLGELGYITENGIRAINLKGPGGIDVGVETGAPEAAAAVAVAAKDKADQIADGAQP